MWVCLWTEEKEQVEERLKLGQRGGMSGISLLKQESFIGYALGGISLREKKQYFFLKFIIWKLYMHNVKKFKILQKE